MTENYPIRSVEFGTEIRWRKCPDCGSLPIHENSIVIDDVDQATFQPNTHIENRLYCPNCGYIVADIELVECSAKWNKIAMSDSDIVFEAGRILSARI